MASSKGKLTRILISVVFIALGLDSAIRAFELLLELDIGGILASALGIFTFITGVIGLLKIKITVCKVFAVIVGVLAAANFINALLALSFATNMLVLALLAWVYFDCN